MKSELQTFKSETLRVRDLVFDKPAGWEYLLTLELLREGLRQTDSLYAKVQKNDFAAAKQQSVKESFNFFRSQTDKLEGFLASARNFLTIGLVQSWGTPGTPGDPVRIKFVIDSVLQIVRQSILWEKEIKITHAAPEFSSIKSALFGSTKILTDEIKRLVSELEKITSNSDKSGANNILLNFDFPKDWNERLVIEMNHLQSFAEKYPDKFVW